MTPDDHAPWTDELLRIANDVRDRVRELTRERDAEIGRHRARRNELAARFRANADRCLPGFSGTYAELWREAAAMVENDTTENVTTDHRASPVDIMHAELRRHLTSIEATSNAMRCWHALRRAGWLQDERLLDSIEDSDDVKNVTNTGQITLLEASPLGYGGWYQLHDGISERSDEVELRISSNGKMIVEISVGGIGASKVTVATVEQTCAITIALPRRRITARAASNNGVEIELRNVA